MNDTQLTIVNQTGLIQPVGTIEQFKARYNLFKDFVSSCLVPDSDFGVIPGTGDRKTLLKPGAEKFCTLFGFTVENIPVMIVEDWTGQDHGGETFLYYRYRTDVSRNGVKIASAEGLATSWEGKYRYRVADMKCPSCSKAAIRRSKFPPRNNPGGEPGWYCHDRLGGCGAQFDAGDKRITEQPRGQIPNPNPADLANTLSKMAQKRSMVGAVLIASNASDYFTQDLEDMSGLPGDTIPGIFRDVALPEEPPTTGSQKVPTQAAKSNMTPSPRNEIKVENVKPPSAPVAINGKPAALTEERIEQAQARVDGQVEQVPVTHSHNGEEYDGMELKDLTGRHTHYLQLTHVTDKAGGTAESRADAKGRADYIATLIEEKRAELKKAVNN